MKFNIPKFFFKVILKLNKNYYINSQIRWGKKSLKSSIFFLSFDFETQKDIEVIDNLTEKLSKLKIVPYYAIPGELIDKNSKILRRISKKSTIINHGYKVHTKFEEKSKRNFSTLSYLDLSYNEIKIDIERAHNSILKICDQIPRIFRTPHFGEYSENSKNNLIYSILKDLGYFYSSSTTPIYSIIYSPLFTQNNIIEMPSSAYIDKPLQIIDSWSMIDKSIDFNFLFNQLNKMYLLMESTNILFNIYFDPSDIINSDNFFNEISKFNKFQNQIEKKKLL